MEPKEVAFGLWKGMTLQQAREAAPFREVLPNQPFLLQTSKPPHPASPFAVYWLRIGPSVGACGVRAFTAEKKDGSKDFIDTAADVLNMLSDRYGPPEVDRKEGFKWKDGLGPGTVVEMAWTSSNNGGLYLT